MAFPLLNEGADAETSPTILINLLNRFVVVHRIHEYPRISIIGEGMVFHHSQLTELTLKRFQTFPMILLPKVVIVHRIHDYPWMLLIREGTP